MNNEKEIQARIEFKMNEFLTSVKNRLAFKHGQAFDMTRKSNDVWEAFKEVSEALKKEIEMATPYDNMDEMKRREARNAAIDAIAERFKIRGTKDNHQAMTFLVEEIKKAQNY